MRGERQTTRRSSMDALDLVLLCSCAPVLLLQCIVLLALRYKRFATACKAKRPARGLIR